MTNRTRISVIVPCFNHGQFLEESVGSVIGCGRKDTELIVVDDGSTDARTQDELDKLSRHGVTVIRQENKGPSAARNAGLRSACGQYILPLDADDRLRDGWIDKALRIVDENPDVGVVYGDAQFFGVSKERWRSGPFDADRLLAWNYILACSLFRRSIWEQAGGYDEAKVVQGFEDWELWIGALGHNWKFVYLPEIFFDYRKGGDSMFTRAYESKYAIAEYVARKHSPLYREALLRHEREQLSIVAAARHLGELIVTRTKRKCGF